MKKCKRIFVIVIDSLGIGEMPDAERFGDAGTNTLGHISESVDSFEIPNLQKAWNGESDAVKTGEASEGANRIPGDSAGKEQWKRYNDRTLGDDGR